ncbi:MAG: hypothetical protein ACXWNK_07060 [Vulcanimicrobiaceae bacterium]
MTASARAEELLLSLLDSQQCEEYRNHGSFVVRGSAGGRYRFAHARPPVGLDEVGNVTQHYCIGIPENYPSGDRLIALTLLVQVDEAEFQRTANTPGRAAYGTGHEQALMRLLLLGGLGAFAAWAFYTLLSGHAI